MPAEGGGAIFISHSSRDRKMAQTLSTALEHRGFHCWISSRDIGPGENFQEAIVRAIRSSQVMVLVFTGNANNSNEIKKEMALASQHNLSVIPIRVEDVVPSDAFTYEFATRQWIDAFDNWETAIERLAQQVGMVVKGGVTGTPAPPVAAAPPAAPAAPRRVPIVAGAVALFLCMAAAVAGYVTLRPAPPDRSARPEQTLPVAAAPAKLPAPEARTSVAMTPPTPALRTSEPPPAASGATFRDCKGCPEMVAMPAGTFQMGSYIPPVAEQPAHPVRVAAPFAIAKFDVTREEYARFVEATSRPSSGCEIRRGDTWAPDTTLSWRDPGFPQTARDPVVCVGWDDAVAYAAWLTLVTGKRYRLPTEAEWEYAARAGTRTRYYWGDDVSLMCRYENVADMSWAEQLGQRSTLQCHDGYVYTSPVGTFQANQFGLHDMLGNAFQWVADCWTNSYAGAPGDSSVPVTLVGNCARVARGGSWNLNGLAVRITLRFHDETGRRGTIIGFRVARDLADQPSAAPR